MEGTDGSEGAATDGGAGLGVTGGAAAGGSAGGDSTGGVYAQEAKKPTAKTQVRKVFRIPYST
jgi:hypothetical protein